MIFIAGSETSEETIPITLALSGHVMQPIAKRKFLELGKKQRLVRLAPQTVAETAADTAAADEIGNVLVPSEEPAHRAAAAHEQGFLDKGTFTQLHDAAQRSGLVPNADLIAYTRDREFRLKDYQKAFQAMEGLYGKFCAAATRRDQRLRREDLDIAAGRDPDLSQATAGEARPRHRREPVGRPGAQQIPPRPRRPPRDDASAVASLARHDRIQAGIDVLSAARLTAVDGDHVAARL